MVASYIHQVFALVAAQNKAVLQLVESQAEVQVFQSENHFFGMPTSTEKINEVMELWMDCKIELDERYMVAVDYSFQALSEVIRFESYLTIAPKEVEDKPMRFHLKAFLRFG